MKKFMFFAILTLGLLSSVSVDAKNPPNGVHNYVSAGGELMVWFNNHYENMGPVSLP